ncbi:MAG: NfeD family protein [Bacilli bacterium]|nr:NfeD family protein [Bacilli bacterium]MDD3304731.1 NfeD family protein [Bacilli bacterium]MDD4053590.1 NfeD family protein [Bacilli bacterium]MDD4411089.1 NfeD family protein [Bacilli bacterium]
MELTWLVIFIIFIIVEILTSNFVTIWFGIGAMGAFFSTYFTSDVMLQFIVFTIVTILSLLLTRPFVKKITRGRDHVKTNLDSVIGRSGIVDAKITPHSLGRVTVLGKDWSAKSEETIEPGSQVEILAIEGVKLIVRKKEGK